jgi:hypothetical protein
MWMLSCGQAKPLDYLNIHQIVAATSINDCMYTAVLDDKKHIEKVVTLAFVILSKCGAQSAVHN